MTNNYKPAGYDRRRIADKIANGEKLTAREKEIAYYNDRHNYGGYGYYGAYGRTDKNN